MWFPLAPRGQPVVTAVREQIPTSPWVSRICQVWWVQCLRRGCSVLEAGAVSGKVLEVWI